MNITGRSSVDDKEFTIPAKVTVSYPDQHGVGYICLQEDKRIAKTVRLVTEKKKHWVVNLDLDEEGHVVGIEFLDAKFMPVPEDTDE
jgi:uncharacterized protein YuzE